MMAVAIAAVTAKVFDLQFINQSHFLLPRFTPPRGTPLAERHS
jgi:hypothetical protein